MVADKSKKLKVAEKGENVEEIDGELVLSIEKLQEIQDELEKINDEASDKVLKIEQKYIEIRKPVYDKRNEIIKSIPDFWTTAFMSHPGLRDLLDEDDLKIFTYFNSLEVEDSKDVTSGYTITLNFDPNPYFENTKLTKTFTYLEEGTTKITATPIKWKEEQSLPKLYKKRNKRSASGFSFFSWFMDTEQKLVEMAAMHDEIADIIKDDLWPNPLTYFNSEEPDEEDVDEEEGNDQVKDEDDSEDDDDDDGQEDDDDDGDNEEGEEEDGK